jgi:hypothetical protein
MSLEILVVPTYSTFTMAVVDASTYSVAPVSPEIDITVPGFDPITITFSPNELNLFNSTNLGLTAVGADTLPIPDGIYTLTYHTSTETVTMTIMRVDQLQERFDNAFMKLDMMECDLAIKKQQKVTLDSIYYFIQGSIAAANNCAVDASTRLYKQALRMITNFATDGCGCTGNNYTITAYYNC